MLEVNKIYNMDCIEGMRQIPSGGGKSSQSMNAVRQTC